MRLKRFSSIEDKKEYIKLVYIGFSFKHHGLHSGYDCIKDGLGYTKIIDCQKSYDILQRISGSKDFFSRQYVKFLGFRLWWIEFKYIPLAIFSRNTIFHFIYAENTYRYFGYFLNKTNRLVCTYHQTIDFYINNPKYLIGIKKIDKIIVMRRDLVASFKALSGNPNVYYIPHGVDADYFKPAIKEKKNLNILMVGDWLRDFGVANEVFKLILVERNDIKINVVCNPSHFKYFDKNIRLNLMSGIKDEELLVLYQQAHLLFLPLKGFTANNSILEGGVCGCKILIATNQQTDSLYLGTEYVEILPLNIDRIIEKIISILDDVQKYNWNNQVKYISSNYSWRKIKQQTYELLTNPYNFI